MELLVGCRNKTEQRKVERFVRRFEIVKLNETIADHAIVLLQQYRLSHGLLIADGLIAATALVVDKPLATKNQRDYRFIEGALCRAPRRTSSVGVTRSCPACKASAQQTIN